MHVNRNMTMALDKVNCFFVEQGSVSFIGAVIRLLDSLLIDLIESLVFYRVFGSGDFSEVLKLNMI